MNKIDLNIAFILHPLFYTSYTLSESIYFMYFISHLKKISPKLFGFLETSLSFRCTSESQKSNNPHNTNIFQDPEVLWQRLTCEKSAFILSLGGLSGRRDFKFPISPQYNKDVFSFNIKWLLIDFFYI